MILANTYKIYVELFLTIKEINLLATERYCSNFRNVIFKFVLPIDIMSNFCDSSHVNDTKPMDDKSTLVQVMA